MSRCSYLDTWKVETNKCVSPAGASSWLTGATQGAGPCARLQAEGTCLNLEGAAGSVDL